MMQIRAEHPGDFDEIHNLNTLAFETSSEAFLADRLREDAQTCISLVATEDEMIIGHIMFSPVMISDHRQLKIMGLGPMAVLPVRQRRGIGTLLVNAGLEECKKIKAGAVVVLGHPEYYPRFGFIPAHHFNIDCEYDVPENTFLIKELQSGYLNTISGTAIYHPAFREV